VLIACYKDNKEKLLIAEVITCYKDNKGKLLIKDIMMLNQPVTVLSQGGVLPHGRIQYV
jgi:hypothetical protein